MASFGVEITLAAELALKGMQGLEAPTLVPQHAGSKPMARRTENRRVCDQTPERLMNN